jgi:GNAT superfamily N-acetyltransferase
MRRTALLNLTDDISLVPEFRNRGIGTFLLNELLGECEAKGLPCELKVLKTNRARLLYDKLGFRVEGDDGVRLHMRWVGRSRTEPSIAK